MSEKKTISINPSLFEFNSTKKKRTGKKQIQIKPSSSEKRNKTSRGKILKYIREQQEKNYKKLFDETYKQHDTNDKVPSSIPTIQEEGEIKNDFESSVNYLKSVLKENEKKQNYEEKFKNTTLKYRPIHKDNLYEKLTETQKQNDFDANDVSNFIIPKAETPYNIRTVPPPQWGCLKGGKLPTYRMVMTRKNHIPSQPVPITESAKTTTTTSPIPIPIKSSSVLKEPTKSSNLFKRKKTIRRTYKIGKSKHKPQVSVLISNRTLRKKITTQSQLLKQTPIEEVKKFLIKKGFIKIGSIAPNDVLRKMYESAILIGGEVQNNNSENLLYNYLHT